MATQYTDQQVAGALAALELNGGNVKATAGQLGMPHATLRLWRDRALSTNPDRPLSPAVPIVRDFATLWADAQSLAISKALAIAEKLTEATPENLTALTKLAAVAADKHLDYTHGRKGGTQLNVDARQQNVFIPTADDLIAAVLRRRTEARGAD